MPFLLMMFGFGGGFLLCLIPLAAGIPIGYCCKRTAKIIWLCISGIPAVVFSVLYHFERQVHAFGWLGLFLGAPLTGLFLGIVIGALIRKQKHADDAVKRKASEPTEKTEE